MERSSKTRVKAARGDAERAEEKAEREAGEDAAFSMWELMSEKSEACRAEALRCVLREQPTGTEAGPEECLGCDGR